ncbi:MAG: hypothetical protein DMG57_44565 [Acidobacteria bacterium]|nr:MAG: hypothetical protein DMG57_44565 [Acidobacteriota bacterium]
MFDHHWTGHVVIICSVPSAWLPEPKSPKPRSTRTNQSPRPPPRGLNLSIPQPPRIAAIANQIIPSNDGPGAREAGVIYFIDRALSTFD